MCQSTGWGEMTLCDAERRLLANALLDISNERFVLLSESCIPIRNFNTTYNYLIMSKHSFIHIVEDGIRYSGNMAPEINATVFRKGSQWFEMSRDLALTIVSDTTKYYYKILYHCRAHSCYPDEHYFHTMLQAEKPGFLANRSITWVDWSRGGAHPATFGEADVKGGSLLNRILNEQSCEYNGQNTTICLLFARKFAPSSLEALLEVLSPTLLGLKHEDLSPSVS
jgi:Core-2/I-Branching enzyme